MIMEESLFNDLMESLNQALEYERGNKSKCRSTIVTISDEEIEAHQMFLQSFHRLSAANKSKVVSYTNELLQAASQ